MTKKIFYKPQDGWCGDFIPFRHEGRFYLYYLKAYRNDAVYGEGTPWFCISTTDFVHFEEHGEIIARGGPDEQDLYVFTGSAHYDGNRFHIFYTGHNPHFPEKGKPLEGIMHAVGSSPLCYEKVSEDTFFAPSEGYEPHDWRDPFVFYEKETDQYNMLIAARLDHGMKMQRGVTAFCTSPDLKTWTVREPFWAPSLFHTHECPDLFKMGDWWYLLYSEFTDRNVTRYVMSRNLRGPFSRPAVDTFDGKAFYAAKTCTDGDVRYICGWNPIKENNNDHGHWNWGGSLVVHELLQADDGSLLVGEPKCIRASFDDGTPMLFHEEVSSRGEFVHVENLYGYACTMTQEYEMKEPIRLEITLKYNHGTRDFGIFFPIDDVSENSYYLRFLPDENRVCFSIWPYNNGPEDRANMKGLERPILLTPDQPIHIVLLVNGTVGVAYVNNQIALSFRMYRSRKNKLGVYTSYGALQAGYFMAAQLKDDNALLF